jgi:hypothetical protein
VRAVAGLVAGLVALAVRLVLRILGLGGRLGGRTVGPPARAGARRLESIGFRRAARGSGAWFALSVLLTAVRVLGRLGARKRQVVWRGELLPGQTVRVGHLLEDRAGRPVRARR